MSEVRLGLRDYLRVLRRRRGLAAAAFALVAGGVVALALFATPVYRSYVLLQLDHAGASDGLLGELQAAQGESNTAAELEIMRSRLVAQGAAARLDPGDFLVEEHAYRPLETTLRAWLPASPPCDVRVETEPLAPGAPAERYAFDFADGGLAVERDGVRERVAFSSGEPFSAFGRRFTLHVEGEPEGRRFLLTLRPPAEAARWIQERVRAEEVGPRTGVVRLAFEAETPRLARRVAQALADAYVELKREHRRARAKSALAFLEEETARVRGLLTRSEDALDRARTEMDAVLLSDRASWIVEQSSALDLDRARLRLRVEQHRRALDSGEPEEMLAVLEAVDPMTQAIADQVARLVLERDGMIAHGLRDAHPERRRVDAELASARERLGEGLRAALSARLRADDAALRQLDAALHAYEAEAAKLPKTERVLAQLEREAQANLQIYAFLVEKDQEAQLALASTLAEVRAIDPAFEPAARSKPRLVLQSLLGLVLGCIAALLAALCAESLDRSVRTAQELETRTGLPLFAAVPDFRTLRKERYRGEMVARDRPHSVAAESYRTLRSNLRFAGIEREVKTVAVTSAVMSEGKTVTTCNLAVACALLGERTVLLDMDLRRSDTHRHFGHERAPGLADWLSGDAAWEDVVRPSGVEKLDVVHAGRPTENPAGLLDSPRVQELLDRLREAYDRVLVDVPPVLAVSDAAAVLPRLDGALLLARAGRCDVETLLAARDQVRRIGANLLGSVLNAVDPRHASDGGYGYGYGYGYEPRENGVRNGKGERKWARTN